MRTIKISEEQNKLFKSLKEDVTVQADVSAAGGDVKRAIDNAKREAQKSGLNTNNMKIVVDANESVQRSKKLYTASDLFRN